MVEIETLHKIICRWYDRSTDNTIDGFDRFISLWISFNAWGCHETDKDQDRQMLDCLKENPKMRDAYDKAKKKPDFLKKLSERINEKIPTHRRNPDYVWLDDKMSLSCLLEVIYRIRCNLFHGRKDPDAKDEVELVEWAHFGLTEIFSNIKSRDDFVKPA